MRYFNRQPEVSRDRNAIKEVRSLKMQKIVARGSAEESNDNEKLLSDAIQEEFDRYLAENSMGQRGICLEWWNLNCSKFPLIAKLASVMLA